MSEKKKPEVISDGYLRINIWTNEGKNGPYQKATISKPFKDDQGNFHDGKNLDQLDLLKLPELARRAYNRMNDVKRENFRDKRLQEPKEHQNDKMR